MPTKTRAKRISKSAKRNKSLASVLVVVFGLLVLGVLGYTVLKNHTSLFSNNSAQAEEKATPEQLAFTPAEKAAADAEPEASRTTILNQNGVNVSVCRFAHDSGWGVNMAGHKTVDAARTIIVVNVNRNRVTTKFVLQRSERSQTSYYGATKSGYIKFLVGQTGAYRVVKFNSLVVC